MGKSQELYKKAKKVIPGGTQLLSKRPEMFLPELWPSYYNKSKGCKVWDLDEIEYLDMCYMGIGANVLGYSDDDVNQAAQIAIQKGSMCTLNAPEEVELAETLLELHPWAGMVRYSKTGGEAVSIAVRIARAFTGRDIVLFCGYHGWSDWYLAANLNENSALDGHLLKGLEPKGVPRSLLGTSYPFHYNDLESLQRLLDLYKGKIAAVVMEPIRNHYPENDFLSQTKRLIQEQGGILIFDEVSSGFRLYCGGSHMVLGVEPDIAVLGKAISNGFPMGVVIGREEIMNAAQETFISSTYWTDRVGLAAALATIKKFQANKVDSHLEKVGRLVQEGWKRLADNVKLKLHISGIYPLSHFDFDYDNPQELKTLFTQEMLKRGFLATNAFYASFSHSEQIIESYLIAVEEVFHYLKRVIDENEVKESLESQVCHSGFQRLT